MFNPKAVERQFETCVLRYCECIGVPLRIAVITITPAVFECDDLILFCTMLVLPPVVESFNKIVDGSGGGGGGGGSMSPDSPDMHTDPSDSVPVCCTMLLPS